MIPDIKVPSIRDIIITLDHGMRILSLFIPEFPPSELDCSRLLGLLYSEDFSHSS